MVRLPTPGGDDGTWGNILNEFLAIEHNSDGTLKTSGSLSTKADDGAVVHKAGSEVLSGLKDFLVSPTVPTPTLGSQAANKTYVDDIASSGTPDADSSTKGKIQLTGDLSGTAASPQIATGVIVDTDVNASANIAQSKIANLTSDLASKASTSALSTLQSNAVLKADTTTAAMSFVVDEDDMVSNLDTKVPTQQSVKAYVDANLGTVTAASVSVVDAGGFYTNSDLENILIELAPAQFALAANGGGELFSTLSSVVGATIIDLADGNLCHITSTNGNYTLSVSGASGTNVTSFMLVIDTSNNGDTPTWFSNITWVSGTPNISWTASSQELFSFVSIDGTNWWGWHLSPAAPILSVNYSVSGTLATGTGSHRLYNDSASSRTIVSVRTSVGTAPTGATILTDINKNGTTIFTTQANRPSIAISGNTAQASTIDVTSWANGDYLTVDIDQVGSTIAGADLVVTINYREG